MTRDDEQPPVSLEVNLNNQGGILTFEDIAGLEQWISEERKKWEWFEARTIQNAPNGIQSTQNTSIARDCMRRVWDNVKAQVPSLRREDSSHTLELFNQIKEAIEDAYNQRHLIHSQSAVGQAILEMSDSDMHFAGAMVCAFMRVPISNHLHSEWVRASVKVALVDEGIIERVGREKELLTSLYEELSERQRSATKTQNQIDSQWREFVVGARDNEAKLIRELRRVRDSSTSRQNEYLKQAQSNLDHFTNAIKRDLSLREPRGYWSSKKSWHVGLGLILLVLFAASIYVGGDYFLGRADMLIDLSLKAQNPGSQQLFWARLAELGIIATLLAWVLRVFSRLMMSQFHLAADAGERAVMIRTFLALAERSETTSDEDLRFVLQAILRPASSGLVKEDAIPPYVIDLANRAGQLNGD